MPRPSSPAPSSRVRSSARTSAGIAVIGCLLATSLLTGTLLTGSLVAASAEPGSRSHPGAERTEAVRRAVQSAATGAARISSRLAAAAARRQRAELALSQAAESFDQAREELAARQRSARLASTAARSATARMGTAQAQLGRLAAQAYRSGGQASGLAVVLSPGGGQDLLDGAALVRTLAEQRRQLLVRLTTARVVAGVMQQRADGALSAQRAAAERVRATRDAAHRRASAARATVAAGTQEQQRLIVRLAAARHTSLALQRRRLQGLATARERREARAARSRHRRAPPPPPVTDTGFFGSDDDGSDDNDNGRSRGGSGGGSGHAAVSWAAQQIGLPYRWGGAGPSSYDCSGLTMRAWQRSGVLLPHSSRMQYAQLRKVSYSRMRPGDLIFWASDPASPGTIHHVALFAGGGMMVEAPAAGLDVRRVPIRWRNTMPFAGRP